MCSDKFCASYTPDSWSRMGVENLIDYILRLVWEAAIFFNHQKAYSYLVTITVLK